jgi:hypothetical protein
MGTWLNLTNGTFKGFTFHYAIPRANGQHGAARQSTKSSQRVQIIRRPGVDGAQTRGWGQNEKVHVCEIHFLGPTYYTDFEKFRKKLEDGQPGLLTLPEFRKAKMCMFHEMDESAQALEANSKVATVTWFEHTPPPKAAGLSLSGIIGTALGPVTAAIGAVTETVGDAASAVTGAISDATSVITDNPIIDGVQSLENSALSVATSATDFVSTLTQTARAEILGAIADAHACFGLIQEAVTAFTGVSATPTAPENLGVDPITFQPIISSTAPVILPPPPNPLALPTVASSVKISANNLDTVDGVTNFASAVSAALSSARDSLVSNTQGRASDAGDAISSALTAFQTLVAAQIGALGSVVILPFTMSLIEVCFYNGIDVANLRVIHKKNSWIDDILVIPGGTQIQL